MKKLTVLILVLALILSFSSCIPRKSPKTNEADTDSAADVAPNDGGEASPGLGSKKLLSVQLSVSQGTDTVSKDEKFGTAMLSMSQEEFEEIGFSLGDSCDVEFGNGYSLSDVPYYNGYYVRNGDPVIVAYPGNPCVSITLNNVGIWDAAGLREGDSVSVTLREAGRYSAVQEALGQVYSFVREEYSSDEEFCNFRCFSAGNMRENFMFRGASPVDNSRGRAEYTDGLLETNGIRFIIDLADSEEDLEGYEAKDDFKSEYSKGLHEDGHGVLLDMSSSYISKPYMEKVAEGFRAALDTDGPVFIHCMEGKDRTGFVCMLAEALAGATYDEMKSDYMTTYANYFRVSKEKTPEKYEAIADLYFVPFMEFLHGTDDITELEKADYTDDAARYLADGGMTEAEIQQFIKLITK